MEEIPSISNYSLINYFISKSYGMAEKYDFQQNMFQRDFEILDEQLELIQDLELNLMFNKSNRYFITTF